MKKVMALYDTDIVYATRLMEYLNKRKDIEFEIIIFTKQEILKEYVLHSPLEILLLGKELLLENRLIENIQMVLYLDDVPELNSEDLYPRVFRYQSADGVWKDILSHYSRRMNQIHGSGSGTRNIISVYSPIPGIIDLNYARYLAQNLSERQKTLFISMELFPVMESSKSTDSGDALSEFIYYLKEGNPIHIDKFNTLLKFNGKLSYLSGLTHGLDLISLTKEDAVRWIGDFLQNMDYDCVIFYMGFYSEFVIELLGQSSRTIVLTENSPYGKDIINEWKRQMEFMGIVIEEPRYQILYKPEEAQLERVGFDVSESRNSELWHMAAKQAGYLLRKEVI